MAGFEVIVRPVILPDIRPQRPRTLAPEDNADSGIAVLSGSGGKMIDLTQSESTSVSRSKHIEKKRKFDVERVYHKDDAGKIDKDQFVDVERVKKIDMVDGLGAPTSIRYEDPPPRDNVEVLETDQVRTNPKAP